MLSAVCFIAGSLMDEVSKRPKGLIERVAASFELLSDGDVHEILLHLREEVFHPVAVKILPCLQLACTDCDG